MDFRRLDRIKLLRRAALALLPFAFQLLACYTTASSATETLDLSYLHRTPSSLLAEAIREQLDKGTSNLDIDVSSSFIGKEVKDLIKSLEGPSVLAEQNNAMGRRMFGVIAKHNQWSTREATLLLEAVVGTEKDTSLTPRLSQEETPAEPKQETEESIVETLEGNSTISVNKTDSTVSESNFTETALVEGNVSALSPTEELPPPVPCGWASVKKLDLGWNNFGSSGTRAPKAFCKALQRTIQNTDRCPQELCLQVCGLGPAECRAIAKGIIARFTGDSVDEPKKKKKRRKKKQPSTDGEAKALPTIDEGDRDTNSTVDDSTNVPLPLSPPEALSLYLTRNGGIGDAGVAALSAAIRTVTSKQKGCMVFENLDLSGCDITDTGAEALAIALEDNPMCVRHLDLSNNRISNDGAAAIGRALSSSKDAESFEMIETLDLSNNKDITDAGARAIGEALASGSVNNLVLRSCQVHADGAADLMRSLRNLVLSSRRPTLVRLDLSGNPLGILRKKTKSGGSKYSAKELRNKASATTTAYMNLIGKTVQKGLKDLGISESVGGFDTLESDDEEEERMDDKGRKDEDPTKIKCGAMAMADAMIFDDQEVENDTDQSEEKDKTKIEGSAPCTIKLGLRHCSFDTRASEALAAIRKESQSTPLMMDLVIDVQMNNVLEESTIAALRGDPAHESDLMDMSERYLEAMEALRLSRERSLQAARAAAARMRAEQDLEDAFGAGVDMGDDYGASFHAHENYDGEDERWDSDADYDEEDSFY